MEGMTPSVMEQGSYVTPSSWKALDQKTSYNPDSCFVISILEDLLSEANKTNNVVQSSNSLLCPGTQFHILNNTQGWDIWKIHC